MAGSIVRTSDFDNVITAASGNDTANALPRAIFIEHRALLLWVVACMVLEVFDGIPEINMAANHRSSVHFRMCNSDKISVAELNSVFLVARITGREAEIDTHRLNPV
jgi:hypothetical protein